MTAFFSLVTLHLKHLPLSTARHWDFDLEPCYIHALFNNLLFYPRSEYILVAGPLGLLQTCAKS